MTEFKVGDIVHVIPLSRLRKIVAIKSGQALCESLPPGACEWFAFDQIRPNDPRPLRPAF